MSSTSRPAFGPAQIFTVVLIGVLWGLNWPAVKVMLIDLPPLSIRAFGFPMAALILALICRARNLPLMPQRRDWPALILTGLFLIFGFNVLTTFGQLLTQASRAAIIAYTMPAMTVVLAAVFLGERLSWQRGLALLAGMAGLLVLASEDFASLLDNPDGMVVMLLAALSWAVGNILLKARQWSLQPLALTSWFFAVSAIVIWPLVLVFEPVSKQSWPGTTVMWILLYHVIGPMSICYALWTVLISRLPAGIVALSALTAPLVGVISSMWLLGEAASTQKLISLGLVLASIILTFKSAERRDS